MEDWGIRSGPRPGRRWNAGLAVLGLAVALAVVRAALLWPPVPSAYGWVLLGSEVGATGAPPLLLAVLLLRPPAPRRAEFLLLVGAGFLAAADAYEAIVASLVNMASAPIQPGVGFAVDPVIVTGGVAIGAWLVAVGLWRWTAPNERWMSWRRLTIEAIGLLAAVAIVLFADQLPSPQARAATAVSAVGVLGWTALGFAAAEPLAGSSGRILVAAGALLLVIAAGLPAIVTVGRLYVGGGATFPLGFLGWLALCGGFAALPSEVESGQLDTAPNPDPGPVSQSPLRPG